MKILIIHNKYGKFSGEESAVESLNQILKDNKHEIINYFRGSEEIEKMIFGKPRAFFSGFYNRKSVKEIKAIIVSEKPDIVHVHNLFPFISPAILTDIKKLKIPIVMTVHNYRLMCPNGLFKSKNTICEKCTSGVRELNCVVNNCENDIFKSLGYALRNFWARKKKHYLDNVDAFLCLTEFQKNKLISNGYSAEKIRVIPNFYNGSLKNYEENPPLGNYVAFAGRITIDKGIELIIDAASKLPHIQFQLAGNIDESIKKDLIIPKNIIFKGMLNPHELKVFYKNARFIILPSIWYEGMPIVLLEAMAHQLPVIAPNMAGFREVIHSNYNGLLFEPLDSNSLIINIESLWNNPPLIKEMGSNAFISIRDKYNSKEFYRKLEGTYSSLSNIDSTHLKKTSSHFPKQKKVLLIHNKYGKHSGEEAVVNAQIDLLQKNNFKVITYFRGSYELKKMVFGKIRAFFTGLYSVKAVIEMKNLIQSENPDIVHIHNLFPLISPAVLGVIKKRKIPIVMTVHNYRLMCPNGLFFNENKICEKCTSGTKELNCIIGNCEDQIFKSIGYALRNYWARKRKYYINNVDTFLCLTEFQKNKLIANGYSSNRIEVLPNFYNGTIDSDSLKDRVGDFVAFVGRLSPEKGIDLLLRAAEKLPKIKFQLAGQISPEYRKNLKIPKNVILKGVLDKDELRLFYKNARFLVLPSICYEGFPMVLPEAMAHKLPIVAPKIGGFPEIAQENVNALLFNLFDEKSLVHCLETLWEDEKLVMEYGNNSYEIASKRFNSKIYFDNLHSTYERLLDK